jgi:hypothetical protein
MRNTRMIKQTVTDRNIVRTKDLTFIGFLVAGPRFFHAWASMYFLQGLRVRFHADAEGILIHGRGFHA